MAANMLYDLPGYEFPGWCEGGEVSSDDSTSSDEDEAPNSMSAEEAMQLTSATTSGAASTVAEENEVEELSKELRMLEEYPPRRDEGDKYLQWEQAVKGLKEDISALQAEGQAGAGSASSSADYAMASPAEAIATPLSPRTLAAIASAKNKPSLTNRDAQGIVQDLSKAQRMDPKEAEEFILMPLERLMAGQVASDIRNNFYLEKTVATFSTHSNPEIAEKAQQLLREWKQAPVERNVQKKRLRQEREASVKLPKHHKKSRKSDRREREENRGVPEQLLVTPAAPTLNSFSRFEQLDHPEMPASLFVKFTNDGEYIPAEVLREQLADLGLTKLTLVSPKPHYYQSALSQAATKELMDNCPPDAPRGACRFWPRCWPRSGYCPFWHPDEEDVRAAAEQDIKRWTCFLCIHGHDNTEEVARLLQAEPCVDAVELARVKEQDRY
jgi:hypothetical protein